MNINLVKHLGKLFIKTGLPVLLSVNPACSGNKAGADRKIGEKRDTCINILSESWSNYYIIDKKSVEYSKWNDNNCSFLGYNLKVYFKKFEVNYYYMQDKCDKYSGGECSKKYCDNIIDVIKTDEGIYRWDSRNLERNKKFNALEPEGNYYMHKIDSIEKSIMKK